MLARARGLPITVKVPFVVVIVTVAVSIVISERVLSRLGQLQRDHLGSLATAYLDGLSSSLLPAMLRDDVWEAFDALDRARQLYASLRPVETIVTKANGEVVAATDPSKVPVMSQLPDTLRERFAGEGLAFGEDGTRAFLRRDLIYQDRSVGTVYSVLDIGHLVAERRSVLQTLVLTNGALALLFAGLGYVAVNRMVRPIRVLSEHLEEGPGGQARPISQSNFPFFASPFSRLFTAYNALVTAERERETLALRLAEEEKVSSLGRLATGMAHEINNPLGGLFNAIDTLKKHGDKPMVRASSLSLIERGLGGIQEVVQAALATYRPGETARLLSSEDFEDVRLLLGPELRRRRQTIDWHIAPDALPGVPGIPLRQALLNLLLNASAASGEGGCIRLRVYSGDGGELAIAIGDSGPGMPESAAAILTGERSYAMLRDGRGLGLWMVRRLMDELGCRLEVKSSQLGGAEVRLLFAATAPQTVTAHVA